MVNRLDLDARVNGCGVFWCRRGLLLPLALLAIQRTLHNDPLLSGLGVNRLELRPRHRAVENHVADVRVGGERFPARRGMTLLSLQNA